METERRPGGLGSWLSACVCAPLSACVKGRGSHYLLIMSSVIPPFSLSSLFSLHPPFCLETLPKSPPFPVFPAGSQFQAPCHPQSTQVSFLQHLSFFLPTLTVFNLPQGCMPHEWSYTVHSCHSACLELFKIINVQSHLLIASRLFFFFLFLFLKGTTLECAAGSHIEHASQNNLVCYC